MAYPIATEASDPTKVMGRRIGAFFIDLIIGLALVFGVSRATIEAVSFDDVNLCSDVSDSNDGGNTSQICTLDDNRIVFFSNNESRVIETNDTYWVDLAILVYGLMVLVGIQGLTGATPGKAIVGIRTVDQSGGTPGIGRALVRWLLWIVDWFPYCCLPVVGGISALSTKGHKRVGDMVAKTYVIDKNNRGVPVTYPGAVAPATTTWAPTPSGTPAFGRPPTPAPGSPAPTAAAPPSVSAHQPTWDPQRNQYVQYDEASGRWLAYDDGANEWKPIE